MSDYKNDFSLTDEAVWLNAASEGPLPKTAADALMQAVKWKSLPWMLDNQRFVSAVIDMKGAVGKFIDVPAREVILANSASFGLHILANGIPWQDGDEVLLMQNDFPTNIVPWLGLAKRGVKVIQAAPRERVLTPEELKSHLTEKTRVFCVSHVHTFTGYTLDIKGFADICREKGVKFVLNLSQSAGNQPVSVPELKADCVVSAGYKWLLGPYGTGFAWIEPEFRKTLDLNRAYWSSYLTSEELKGEGPLTAKQVTGAGKYDVFGTANFFNYIPWKKSLDYLMHIGLNNVAEYNRSLVDVFIDQCDESKYDFISPKEGPRRSPLIVISHKDKARNEEIFQHLKSRRIFTALWKGNIRIAPHIYNTDYDIKTVCQCLNKAV